MKERILDKKEIAMMTLELEEAGGKGESAWNRVWSEYTERKARLEFPLGEVMNPKISGYVWAWKMRNILQTKAITEKDKFKAQGLEGKISVQIPLLSALLAWRELPEHRRQIIEIESKYLV